MSKEALFSMNFQFVPEDQWYSTDPYIDAEVRRERVRTIQKALQDANVSFGDWATNYVEDLLG
jgi:hypothetical protein|tara:strand:- start:322 stop:510 length:189 start_codon:yes stop_codon:yes gene_type:complete